jgi:YbbR domain-containing protein
MVHPFRHLGLKFVALALATLLWLSVAGEHIVERIMRVPLEFRNIPAELEVVGDPPATVDVRLRGSSGLLSRLEGSEVVAVIDLSTARPGSRLFHIRNDEVRAPYGVEVAQVVPGTLAIELEKSATRIVPIVPPLEGDPAPGFVVGRITSEPSTVEIRGPESRVKRLSEAITEPVTITASRERVRDVVTVGVADSALRLSQPQSATVIVDIWPAPVERDIADVPVRWRNLATGFHADVVPRRARITVRGRKEALTGLGADTIEAFVDLAGLGPGRYNLRVQTDPSQDFGVSAVSPQVVDVTIKQS